MTQNPCKDCPDRHVGCHADCAAYKDWKTAHDAEKDACFKAKQEDATFRKYKIDVRNHAKKRARMRNEVIK